MKPYYESDGITIYHGDCRAVLASLPDGLAGCTITDPPYSDQTKAGARTNPNGRFAEDPTLVPFAITYEDLSSIFAETARISKRWCVATVDWKHAAELERLTPAGLRFVRCGVWVKPDGAPQFTGDRPAQGWEAVAILHRADTKLRWNGGGSRAVWNYHIVRATEVGHPTPKPLPLMRDLVGLFSDADELILDPFMGSGTTLVAAKALGRKAIGIELEEKYCELAARRLGQSMLAFSEPEEQVTA